MTILVSRIPATTPLRKAYALECIRFAAGEGYTERLADAGVAASVGSRGDSYDNALAESFNGLYKTEVIRPHGPWRGLDDVEYATLEYVDWFNQRRLHGEIGMIPPAEFEAFYYHQGTPDLLAVSQ